VRNGQGRIIGMKIRPYRQSAGRKYVWFSAGDGEGSIGQVGSVVHVAYPPRPVSRQRIVATESPLKANIAADLLCMVVMAGDGVTNTSGVPAAVAALGDVEEVWIANDQEAKTNKHADAGEARLARTLADAGYRVKQLTWPAEAGKGLDDILTSTPPTIPVAMPHPALEAETPVHDATPELAEVKRLHSLANAARRSPNLGTERHTLTDFATMLSNQREGEWVSAPYSKIGDQAGIDARTAERNLAKAGIRPKERDAGVLAGLIEVELREVPERVNETTGQVTGGYKAVHVRRLAPLPDLLHRIATAPAPAKGVRNNHGGKRECPKCGSTTIVRTITDRCECGELIKQTTQAIVDDEHYTPPRQDDAHPPAANGHAVSSDSTETVYRGDNLPPTPEEPRTLAERARQATREDRRRLAHASLTALQAQTALEHDFDDQTRIEDAGAPEPPSLLTLFPLSEAGCLGCGAYVAAGQSHCRDCDPRTA
jgi:hypothetical protein